jgi:hypothetical protein
MKYYRVKPEADQRKQYNNRGEYAGFYIGNELYTEREAARQHLNPAFMEPVEISKKKIFWSFGARFESMEV